jgi:type IV pilus assembly protein PilC
MKIDLNKINNIFFRLSVKEKMLFARHMEVMISSGMQILDSLKVLKRQAKSKAFIAVLDSLINDVQNGHFLSVGLEKYKGIFGDFFINLVRVGETSGTLADNLKYLSEELKKKQELQGKIRGAMIYPVFILIVTIGITAMLTFFVFPKVLPVFNSLGVDLPLVTRVFIAFSQFMITYGGWLFLGSGLLAIGIVFLLRIRSVQFFWHRAILVLPVIKQMSQAVNMVNFARTLSLLLKSGMKIVESLNIAADTLSNLVYREEFKKVSEGVRKGDPMSKYLTATTKLFPPIFAQMILIGENTGKLSETANYLANFYEDELDGATKTLSNVLEPLLLVTMGAIVSMVALSIVLPIYKISQGLGR